MRSLQIVSSKIEYRANKMNIYAKQVSKICLFLHIYAQKSSLIASVPRGNGGNSGHSAHQNRNCGGKKEKMRLGFSEMRLEFSEMRLGNFQMQRRYFSFCHLLSLIPTPDAPFFDSVTLQVRPIGGRFHSQSSKFEPPRTHSLGDILSSNSVYTESANRKIASIPL